LQYKAILTTILPALGGAVLTAERHHATLRTWPSTAEEEVNIPSITIKNASLAYAKRYVFKDINLQLPAGRWIGLLGSSGIGKSSLLRLISNLSSSDQCFQGNIVADNGIAVSLQTAYMAQTDLLLPWLNVLNNTLLSLKLRTFSKQEQLQKKELALHLLAGVGLKEALSFYPHQLSGGMRQRVALVRTLLEDKPIVLMDEPFSALDAISRYKLQELAAKLLHGKTVLFVTHDPLEALRLANDIYILQGKPAHLKLIATFETPIPRSYTDKSVMDLQATLFEHLAAGSIE